VTKFINELQETKDEVERLMKNWQALLDGMPGMVFLIREDFVVEYMNRSARQRFGNLQSRVCSEDLQAIINSERNLFHPAQIEEVAMAHYDKTLNESIVEGVPVEYTVIPFIGYTGISLAMIILRDVTVNKQHEREIRDFHANIEEILWRKISELQESEEVRRRLSRQVNSLKSQLESAYGSDKMIGNCAKMRQLREMIQQVATSDATILITGESGTGKELVANKVRESSNRANQPFLKINCNSINDGLLESDLFGHEKGSFTGAVACKKGKFEIVNGGTIFLDEIGDISPRMQSSLLRVLQNGEIVRVGGNESIKIDVRVIAATNVDLAKEVEEKRFRLDLYYRLNIINIKIPPLRERKDDIVDLVSFFVKHYREAFKKDIDFVPQTIIHRLLEHDWPGNVRELENLIQRAVLMAKGNMITEENLLFDQDPRGAQPARDMFDIQAKLGTVPLKNILAEFEEDVIDQALKKAKGSVVQASRDLQVGKTALYDKMKRYEISAKSIKRKGAR
jgi:PAS domain S-box-containing protein